MTAPGDPPPPAPRGPLRWCFEDRASGRIVVTQWPNLPVWIILAAFAAQWLLKPAGGFGILLQVVIVLGLAWWGLDELIRGANPWRRALGVAALAYMAWRAWALLAA